MITQLTPAEMESINSLAFLLEKDLHKTISRFFTKRKGKTKHVPETITGAANIMWVGVLVNSCHNKAEALKILEANFEVLRNMIEHTEDSMYPGYAQAN